MASFLQLLRRRDGLGFTLIELLVVIAIIGVLASIVLASLNSAREKSRDARRVADIKQIQLALELYFDAQPSLSYPATLAPLAPTYIPTVPNDPLGTAYNYARCSSNTSYHLAAALEDQANPALGTDRDGVSLCGAAFQGNLEADNTNATCSTTDADRNCYDVTP